MMRRSVAVALLLLPVSCATKSPPHASAPAPTCAQPGLVAVAPQIRMLASASETLRRYGLPAADTAVVVPDKAAELKNREAVRAALIRYYPQALKDAAVSGTAEMAVVIDTSGNVAQAQVHRTSGIPELDAAALKVVRAMAFTPGLYRGCRIQTWTSFPIKFRTTP